MKRSIALILLFLMPATLIRAADDKPPKPTDDQIKALLVKLGDDHPAVRQEARGELMGLPGESLDDLHRIATTAPAQPLAVSVGLHDVVCHLFLKREGYVVAASENKNIPPTYVLGIPGPAVTMNDDENVRMGYPITVLVPGLPNYQYLRVGDLVTGIYIDPKLPLTRNPNQQVQNWAQFRTGIQVASRPSKSGAVPVVEMQVIRGGESIRVKVPLTPKPAELDNDNPGVMQTFLTSRANRAERYWHTQFAVPLKLESDE